MTAIQPPAFMQNLTNHTAETDRSIMNGFIRGNGGGLVSMGGINFMIGGAYKVVQTGSGAMSVDIPTGVAYVPGSEASKQGTYCCVNDATVTVTVTTAHATLPRIDTVVAQVRDTAYSGVNNDWILAVIAGTPASSPVAPTLPSNSMALADVRVNAGVTQILNANITDRRSPLLSPGDIQRVSSYSSLPAASSAQVYDGLKYVTLDTDITYQYNVSMGLWIPVSWPANGAIQKGTDTVRTTSTISSDPQLQAALEANATYEIIAHLYYAAISAEGFQTVWSVPAGVTTAARAATGYADGTTDSGSGANTRTGVHNYSTQVGYGTRNSASNQAYAIERGILTTTTAGTFALQWAQETTGATGAKLAAQSRLEVRRLS